MLFGEHRLEHGRVVSEETLVDPELHVSRDQDHCPITEPKLRVTLPPYTTVVQRHLADIGLRVDPTMIGGIESSRPVRLLLDKNVMF